MSSALYSIEIHWTDGSNPTRLAIFDTQLGGLDFATWLHNYVVSATRPHWARLGDFVFYTQNVRSIELIETFDDQEG